MITYILGFMLLFCNALQAHQAVPCEQQAFVWCSKLKHEKLSGEDTIVLLNVTYWSWARSMMIMHAQKAVAEFVEQTHKLIHTSMAGRMNPARLCAIAGCTTPEWRSTMRDYEQAHLQLMETLQAYRYASATYAQCLEYILKTDYASPVVAKYTQKMRDQARTFLVDTLEDHALSINKVMETLSKVFECVAMRNGKRGIVELALNVADMGVFNSYAKFDAKYCRCNDAVWTALAKSYALGNIMWDISEQARAQYYTTYHRMLLRAFADALPHDIPSAFNTEGFVAAEQRTHCITPVYTSV